MKPEHKRLIEARALLQSINKEFPSQGAQCAIESLDDEIAWFEEREPTAQEYRDMEIEANWDAAREAY